MSSNTVPITPGAVKGFGGSVTTAQTDKTGLTAANIVTAYTATAAASGGNGALVQDIIFNCPTTSALGTLVLFKKVSGVRIFLKEVAITAITGSATVAGYTSGKLVLNEFINAGDTIDVLVTVTQTIHFSGNAGEY